MLKAAIVYTLLDCYSDDLISYYSVSWTDIYSRLIYWLKDSV